MNKTTEFILVMKVERGSSCVVMQIERKSLDSLPTMKSKRFRARESHQQRSHHLKELLIEHKDRFVTAPSIVCAR